MSTASIDRGLITARVPIHVQETLEIAANLVGATMNQFIVQTALREAERIAERIIEQEKVIHLNALDAEALLLALDNPPMPNVKLLATL